MAARMKNIITLFLFLALAGCGGGNGGKEGYDPNAPECRGIHDCESDSDCTCGYEVCHQACRSCDSWCQQVCDFDVDCVDPLGRQGDCLEDSHKCIF
jgi:hypothetical protein